jgi:Domain of unknown function (DUF4386)
VDGDRRTAVVVGVLFISATVASILGSLALGSALDGDDYLVNFPGGQVILASVLFLVAATSAFGTAVLLFPILRRHNEGLAAGYVGLRAFENILYAAGVVGLLMMLTVSESDAAGAAASTDLRLVGAALLALHSWAVLLGTLIFAGLGSLTLNCVLYRSRLVPRWLSAWGLIGAAGIFVYGLLGIFGVGTGLGSPYTALAMPLAVQEMVFAIWLVVKGLRVDETQHRRTPQASVQPAA